MRDSMEICDMVQKVAAIIQNQGQHDFPSYDADDEVRTASLCGLTVFIENGYVVRIRAHDVDVILNSYFHKAANDERVVALSGYAHYSFLRGDVAELEGWLARLERFQSVFRHKTCAGAADKGTYAA